jgi:hypothetical protein
LSVRTYTDKNKTERTAVEVIAQEIRFLSSKGLATVADMAPPEQATAAA